MPRPGSSTTPGSQSSLREATQRRLIQAVRAAEAPTQAEIARSTGLSRATVSDIVRELAADGVLVTTPTSAGGRRARAVSLAPAAGLAVGVDFGHSHLRVAVFPDPAWSTRHETPDQGGPYRDGPGDHRVRPGPDRDRCQQRPVALPRPARLRPHRVADLLRRGWLRLT
jgi:DNA-binding transcriptional MocR family regulator